MLSRVRRTATVYLLDTTR